MQISGRIYERLTPDERFRVAVEALSRRDEAEIDRLNDTCPEENVRIQSTAYFGRLRGFYELAMMHGGFARNQMLGIWSCLWKLRREFSPKPSVPGGREFVARDSEGEELAKETNAYPADADDSDETWSKLGNLIGRLKAYRAAWAEFCEGIGVDPSQSEFAYYQESQAIVELLDEIDVDQATQAELLQGLREGWKRAASR